LGSYFQILMKGNNQQTLASDINTINTVNAPSAPVYTIFRSGISVAPSRIDNSWHHFILLHYYFNKAEAI